MFNQQQLKQVESTPGSETEQEVAHTPVSAEEAASTKSIMENTDIYYMPENFQKNNQVAGRNMNVSGITVLVLGILFLLLMGGGLYIYLVKPEFLGNFFKHTPAPSTDTVIQTTTTTTAKPDTSLPTADVRPVGAPKDVYLAFRSELELADTVDKYLAVFSRYGTEAKQAQLASQKANLESVGGQGDILTALKGTALPVLDGTENIREDISDTRSVLTVSKTSGRLTGMVILLAEKGSWKISEETWIDSGTDGTSGGQPTAAADDDKDGLTNSEEAILGTNAKASDSDTDGYNDLAELNNNYNPAGAGAISANKNIGTYLNTTFNFSLLYPLTWNRTIASTDDSVVFTAANHQFVQILVQPNSNQDDIIAWYKKTFNVQTVPTSQLVINESWDGVKAPDGLTVYLTAKDKSYIFVITYNLGTEKVLEYKNIFDMMVRSLKLKV